jgi:hydrogenase maturation protease
MGDEGIGVHAVRRLQDEHFPAGVDLLDGGTGGFHLLSLFQDYTTIVLIDASMNGKPPGAVDVIRPRFASDFPRTLTAHDIGLRDMIEAASLVGPLPKLHLVTIAIDTIVPMTMELSPPVKDSVGEIGAAVRRIVDEIVNEQSPAG